MGKPNGVAASTPDLGGLGLELRKQRLPFRALVAEPASSCRQLLIDVLREYGVEVDVLEDDSAHRRAPAGCYNLICADARMVQAVGAGVAADLRACNGAAHLVITDDQDRPEVRALVNEGVAVTSMTRPYSRDRWRSFIRFTMTRKRRRANEQPPRIVMYSHDTIGLGHTRRNTNIASAVLRIRPDASVLMLIGCPAGLVFDTPPGIDFVKLPSLVKQSRQNWRPEQLNISAERMRDLRTRLIREAIAAFEPHALLVDHMAGGVWNELLPALECLHQLGAARPVTVLGLRDILDDPAELRRRWQEDGTEELIHRHYDEILVYGDPAIFDTTKAYGLDELAPDRIHACGFVVAELIPGSREAVRQRLGVKDRPLVLITGGGGRDAFGMMTTCLDSLASLEAALRPAALLVPGPLMDPEERRIVHDRAAMLKLACFDRLPDLTSYVAAADMMIGMAGYNSSVEALAEGLPTLLVARNGPSAEQTMRADLFRRRGLVDSVRIDQLDVADLAQRLARVERRRDAAPAIDVDGAARAAARLLASLDRQEVAAPVAVEA
jgi:predicted glycosyltransferase